MKRTDLVVSSLQLDPSIEKYVRREDARLKDLAERTAKHFAEQKPPQPLAAVYSLHPYTGELKAGYEQLHAEVRQQLQPAANFPEAKIDLDHFREKDAALDKQVEDLEHQNRTDAFELGAFDPRTVYGRIRLALIATVIVTVGEILFNTKAFQVTGESLLFAFILSVCLSFAVFVFSHIVPLLYKAAKNALQRVGVVAGSLLLITGLFTALAIFRSQYLAAHDVHVSPVYFVLINLFFFIVSALISFFVLPGWEEIKQNARGIKLHLAIKKRKKEIAQLAQEKSQLRDALAKRTKERIRIVHLSNHYADRIGKMYEEAMAIFKRVNLANRRDGRVPDCFNGPLPQLDIQIVESSAVNVNRRLV